jgi:hypothetical protein
MQGVLASEGGQLAFGRTGEDEAKFIDIANSTMFVTEEHTILTYELGAARAGPGRSRDDRARVLGHLRHARLRPSVIGGSLTAGSRTRERTLQGRLGVSACRPDPLGY